MKIQLSQIKPSPKPIRSSWDEEKMEELKSSLIEEGQVEPIGVHRNGNGYIIVWGHRRTEAARRAGWNEIEAVIVQQSEVDNLIQAGIENLAGEDMTTEITLTEITDDNRDALVRLALSMYLGEICPYCMKKFETFDDLKDSVYNGYTEYGRIAHANCFHKAHPLPEPPAQEEK